MALLDVLEEKDIKALFAELRDFVITFETSFEFSFEAGKLRAKVVTRPRTREERTAMLDAVMRAR